MEIVNLGDLERVFQDGEKVTPVVLEQKGLIESSKNRVKILGEGKLTKKLIVSAHGFSKSAREAIKKANGKIYAAF
jgi:large subunit ribosomal protein L15